MAGHAGDLRVLNELDRIRPAGVLGDRGVAEVDVVRELIVDDILENRAEAECPKNVRLALRRKINRLGVTTAFYRSEERR